MKTETQTRKLTYREKKRLEEQQQQEKAAAEKAAAEKAEADLKADLISAMQVEDTGEKETVAANEKSAAEKAAEEEEQQELAAILLASQIEDAEVAEAADVFSGGGVFIASNGDEDGWIELYFGGKGANDKTHTSCKGGVSISSFVDVEVETTGSMNSSMHTVDAKV